MMPDNYGQVIYESLSLLLKLASCVAILFYMSLGTTPCSWNKLLYLKESTIYFVFQCQILYDIFEAAEDKKSPQVCI